jgi:hypothetical protein
MRLFFFNFFQGGVRGVSATEVGAKTARIFGGKGGERADRRAGDSSDEFVGLYSDFYVVNVLEH